jgi:hypothetical protein
MTDDEQLVLMRAVSVRIIQIIVDHTLVDKLFEELRRQSRTWISS